MKKPYTISTFPLYKKNNGMYVMDITQPPPNSEYTWIERLCLYLPSSVVAGNHSHHHAEAFLAMTEGLYFYWQDDKKHIHSMHMFQKDEPFFLIVPPDVPHAVLNKTKHGGTIVKYANEPPGIMTRIVLVEP